MNSKSTNPTDPDRDRLIAEALGCIRAGQPDFAGRWLLVDAWNQVLYLLAASRVIDRWVVSTAAVGLDTRQDSGGTPCGLHRIDRKIGDSCEPGMIFESRQSTGILWRPTSDSAPGRSEDDLILTRILTLEGMEDGINRGQGVDSKQRYIYIHGTNHEVVIGSAVSGGCIRMANADVMVLFEQVEEGDPVVIL